MNRFIVSIKPTLTYFIAVTVLCGILYLAVQQTLRQTANDPQIQMAEDTAAALARREAPEALRTQAVVANKIDMARSLAPYVISFDEEGRPIESTVQLEGKTPVPPAGTFAVAKARGENRVTWQPRPGVRSATVIVHYSGSSSGFVLAGRSLRETEDRTSAIGRLIAAGWFACLCALLAFVVVLRFLAMLFHSPKGALST